MTQQTSRPPISFLHTLSTLRWLAIAGQAITVVVVTHALRMPVPQAPLWLGIAFLAVFNLYARYRSRRVVEVLPVETYTHIAVDVCVLAWLIAWSGGIANPFTSLFLLPIAFAALALPVPWLYATALLCALGYGGSVWFGRPFPHMHQGIASTFDLHLWGMAVNYVMSALLVLYFLSRMAVAIRENEQELSLLREQFARNEGIVALAMHAASVAHELNTPLGSMMLMLDDLIEEQDGPWISEELRNIRVIVDVCRDRVRELAAPTCGVDNDTKLEDVIERWRLLYPEIQLDRTGSVESDRVMPVSVAHLLQVLLNNAADASRAVGKLQVDLWLEARDNCLRGRIRDYGAGFGGKRVLLPRKLHSSAKPDGLGIGLALSHATLERLGGTLVVIPVEGDGVCVEFGLPFGAETSP